MKLGKLSRRWRVVATILIILLAWAGVDLFGSRHSDLREFDSDAVARLETDMWRSYYDRRQVRMFFELADLLRTQYRVPFLRSQVIAFEGAKAAFVFKDGKQRGDYERALPDLVRYYDAIREVSETPFDVKEVARLELEWWIIHRERDKYRREALDRSLAELQSAIYQLPIDRFMEHGKLRAEAMLIRDKKWESGGVSESDWQTIHDLLRRSWGELWQQVHQAK
jgi:hypothetical protein